MNFANNSELGNPILGHPQRRRMLSRAIGVIGILVLLLVVCVVALIGQSFSDSKTEGPQESDILTTEEIEACIRRPHRTWSDLQSCLKDAAYAPRIESSLRHKESRNRTDIDDYLLNSRSMRKFVLNSDRKNQALKAADTVMIAYVGNEAYSRCSGNTAQWIIFIGDDDTLIGWIRYS